MINFLTILAILSVLFSIFKLWLASDPWVGTSENENQLDVFRAIYFLVFAVFLLLLAILIKINPFW